MHILYQVDLIALADVKVVFNLWIILKQLDGLVIVLGHACNLSAPLETVNRACPPLAMTCHDDMFAKTKHIICYDRFSSLVGTENRGGSEVEEILTAAHREFGGCAQRCAGKPKCRDQDRASPRRRGHARSGTAEE